MRDFFRSPAGRATAGVFLAVALAAAVYSIYSAVRQDPAIMAAETPLFVDVDSGKTFPLALTAGLTLPVKSPFTGKSTGYPAELCFWTKDGKPKADPTAVVLNELLGKPGPTFCPDCGRLVVHHNPAPPNARLPMTREEYESSHGS